MAEQQCTCTICGSQFQYKRHKANLYCGMACYRVAQRRGDYKRGSKIQSVCTECGVTFSGRGKSRKRNGEIADKVFCGRECYDKHRADIIKAERSSRCIQCGKEYIKFNASAGKYCSMDCRTEHKRPSPINCVNCGCWFTAVKPIRRKTGVQLCVVSNAKTCGPECLSEWARINPVRKEKISKAFRAEKHPNWQGGSHYGCTRGPGWQRIAEKCRDLHGRKCKHCGMSEEDSKSRGWGRLQVNHIVPFWQWSNKTKANAQSNLEALCKSCHTKADWKWRKENAVQMTLSIFR